MTGLQVTGEIQPGMPVSVAISQGQRVVTKAGAFGGSDAALADALTAIARVDTPDHKGVLS